MNDPGPTPPSPAPAAPVAPHAERSLASAVRTVSSVTLLSRFGGLLREVLVQRMFGDTALGSAFAAGFQVPNLFRRLFGEGALSAAFIPEYAQLVKHDPPRANQLASIIAWRLLLATTALTLLVELALLIVLLSVPHDHTRTLSITIIMVMLPYMPLICVAAILGGMLQVHHRFAAAAAGPILLNSMILAVGLYFLLTGQLASKGVAYALGVATVASGITQCLWYARLLRPHVAWTRRFDDARPNAAATLKRFTPAAIGLGTLQLNTFLDTLIAMWPIWVGPTLLGQAYPLDERSNVILTGAQRLYQFPLGVFGIAVATAVFTLLARHADDPLAFLDTLRRGIRLSLFIGLPASIGLFLVAHQAIAVPYSGGSAGWSAGGVERGAAVLAGFALAIWAYSLNHVLTRAFYARGDTRTPMRVAIAMVILNIALNLALIWPLREAGLAWATAISATVQCIALIILARRFTDEPILDRPTIVSIARVAAATFAMAAVVLAASRLIPWPASWLGDLLHLLAAAALGIATYVGAAVLLRCQEFFWLLQRPPRSSASLSARTGSGDDPIG